MGSVREQVATQECQARSLTRTRVAARLVGERAIGIVQGHVGMPGEPFPGDLAIGGGELAGAIVVCGGLI